MLLNTWQLVNTWNIPQVIEDAETGGGFAFRREQQRYKEEEERRNRKIRKIAARRISNEIDRNLALAERKLEEREARDQELARFSELVQIHKVEVIQKYGKIAEAVDRALTEQSFASLEILERKLNREMEEQAFFLIAVELILYG
jgi:hypothetical protein